MTAMRSSSTFRTRKHGRVWLALVFLSVSPLATSGEAITQPPIPAVFKAREVDFIYRSSTYFYPCHELETRVANILLAVGARDDIDVNVSDCQEFLPGSVTMRQGNPLDRTNPWDRSTSSDRFDSSTDRDQSAHVRVRLMIPVEVTPEVLAEIDKDKSRRDLVARVSGNAAAALTDPVVFAAQRQQVKLSGRLLRLEPGDCQLLEQMMLSVFRKLDVRVVRRNFTCDRRQPSRIPPQLTVDALLPTGALMPMPAPQSDASPSAPAAAESDSSEPDPAAETPPQ